MTRTKIDYPEGKIYHLFFDLKFEKDGKIYHFADVSFENTEITKQFSDVPEGMDFTADYTPLGTFIPIDSGDENPSEQEITDEIVDFLGFKKLYLKEYSIVDKKTRINYKSLGYESQKFHDLTYRPVACHTFLKIDCLCDLEDGVDYDELLKIKLKKPVNFLTADDMIKLGIDTAEDHHEYIILSDEDAKKYVNFAFFSPRESYL